MPHVDDVDITFSLYDRSVASQTSMTQLVECIGKLSGLSSLEVWEAHNRLDVGVILEHLSQSASKSLTDIHFKDTHVGDAISHMSGIMPRLEYIALREAALEDRHITELCGYLRKTTNLSWLEFSENLLSNASVSCNPCPPVPGQ